MNSKVFEGYVEDAVIDLLNGLNQSSPDLIVVLEKAFRVATRSCIRAGFIHKKDKDYCQAFLSCTVDGTIAEKIYNENSDSFEITLHKLIRKCYNELLENF